MKFITELVNNHLERYPAMEIRDIYKLLQQSAMGAGHAHDDTSVLQSAFESEIKNISKRDDEPIIDPISPDGKIARIHLGACLQAGYDLEQVFQAFVETARHHGGNQQKLVKFCNCLVDLGDTEGFSIKASTIKEFTDKVALNDYPYLRHSDSYREKYTPAYRIVHLDFLEPNQ